MLRDELSPISDSPLSRVVVEHVDPIHIDERRAIVEFQNDREIPFTNLRVIRINQPGDENGFRLGNHYHDDIELFFLEDGEIDTLVLEDPQTGERQIHRNLGPNTRIFLPPKVAHLLIFRGAATLLAFNENPFNPQNFVPHTIDY